MTFERSSLGRCTCQDGSQCAKLLVLTPFQESFQHRPQKLGDERRVQLCCQVTYSTTHFLSFSTADLWGLVFCLMGGGFSAQGSPESFISPSKLQWHLPNCENRELSPNKQKSPQGETLLQRKPATVPP